MLLAFAMVLVFAFALSWIWIIPGWLQAAVRHNPVPHLTSASRGLMHGEPVVADVLWVLGESAAIVLVAAPIAFRMYRQER